jgi:hypothetical protein
MKLTLVAVLGIMAGCVYAPPRAPTHVPAPAREKTPCPLPTEQERHRRLSGADCGPVPGKVEQAAVVMALQPYLRDPESLKDVEFGQPYKEMLWGDAPDTYRFVWRVDFRFRARNGFGGYNLQTGCADFLHSKLTGLWVD